MKTINIEIKIAKTFLSRLLGFMFKKNVKYAILLKNCRSVHTFFMRFNIDIVFLDKENKIIKVVKNVKPFRIVLPIKNSFSILEVPSNILNIENIKNIDF
ncbi:MAG: DUF192 domain-containing protein [Endomicrobium sp.]|jgi:uncharacterized membrane protein (UPF0127 family)|nr:DUF192 domain-containing protein [Endomicrobium sp.]